MRSHFKICFLIVLLTFLLAGRGIIVPKATAEEGAAKSESHEGGGGEGEGGEKKAEIPKNKKDLIEGALGDPETKGFFIELKQMNVVSIYRNEPVRHMNIIVVVEMPDKTQYDLVLDKVEILRSAFVEELHALGSSQRGVLLTNFDFVKKRLMTTAEKTIGPGHIQNVLIKASAGRVLPGYYMKNNTKP